MLDVLFKSLSFVIVIVIAYALKQRGSFSPTDYKIVTKIAINIILPAAILTAFGTFERNATLFILVLVGFLHSLFMWAVGFFISRKKDRNTRIHYMLNLPCFNVGSFTLPFVQSFLGAYGVVATCMYDIGNAIMSSGGTYALTSSVLNPNIDKKAQLKNIGDKLIHSVPFLTYTTMLIIATIGITIPQPIFTLCSTIASANGFMAMFMLGLMLDLNIDRNSLKKILQTLSVRYALCAVSAFLFYNYSPFSLIIRQILVLIMFTPSSALVPPFTEMCGGNMETASFSSSLSIIISVFCMTILINFLGI